MSRKGNYLRRKKARVDSEIESDGSLPWLHEDVVDEVVTVWKFRFSSVRFIISLCEFSP